MGVKPGDRIAIAMRKLSGLDPDLRRCGPRRRGRGADQTVGDRPRSSNSPCAISDPTVLAADLPPRPDSPTDALRQRRTAVLLSDIDGDAETLVGDSLAAP